MSSGFGVFWSMGSKAERREDPMCWVYYPSAFGISSVASVDPGETSLFVTTPTREPASCPLLLPVSLVSELCGHCLFGPPVRGWYWLHMAAKHRLPYCLSAISGHSSPAYPISCIKLFCSEGVGGIFVLLLHTDPQVFSQVRSFKILLDRHY